MTIDETLARIAVDEDYWEQIGHDGLVEPMKVLLAVTELEIERRALAAKWDEAAGTDRDNESRALREVAAYLRAALATPPAVQRDAEVGARALREAADDYGGHNASVKGWLRARADALAPDGRES